MALQRSMCLLGAAAVLQVFGFTPPEPKGGQGFGISLDIAVVQRQDTTSGNVENLATVDVFDTQEFAYLVHASIGGQNFMLTLDTASSDLWVASSECTDPDCKAVPTYAKTSTLALSQAQFNLKYVQGNVSGSVGYETVSLGQVEVYEQVFGMVTNVSSINMAGMRNSGILGLAFPRSSNMRRSSGKTLLENLYEGLDENNRFFAFRLGRAGESNSFTIASFVGYHTGKVDSSQLSSTSLSYFPVYPINIFERTYDYWKMPLHMITVDGTPLSFSLSPSRVKGSSAPIAVLDTGTSLMLGPTHDVAKFWNSVGGAQQDGEFWMVRCNRALSVSFVFGGVDGIQARTYALNPRDLSWNGTRKGDWCLGGIQGNDKVMSGDWLLGDAFLRNVYATHHAATASTPPLIGLANLTDPASAMVAFQTERGKDPTSRINFRPKAVHSETPFFLLSAAAGFASGLLVILALKLGVCRRVGSKGVSF